MQQPCVAQMKPLSHREQCYIQKHCICLLRNLDRVRRIRQRILKANDKQNNDEDENEAAATNNKEKRTLDDKPSKAQI